MKEIVKSIRYYGIVLILTALWCVVLTLAPPTGRLLGMSRRVDHPDVGICACLIAAGIATGAIVRWSKLASKHTLVLSAIGVGLGLLLSVTMVAVIMSILASSPGVVVFGLFFGLHDGVVAVARAWYATVPMALLSGFVMKRTLVLDDSEPQDPPHPAETEPHQEG